MGTKELREAFNSVSQPKANCTLALQGYERDSGGEWQILTFRGTTQGGGTFEIRSNKLKPRTDLNEAAKEAAQQLLETDLS